MAQHIPEIQITLGECSSLRQKPGPRIRIRASARAKALKVLCQKVTSKLGVESRCRVTTPAMLQSRVTKIIRDTARECDIVFNRKKKGKSSPAPLLSTVKPPGIPDTYSLVGLPARIRSNGKLLQASGFAKLGAPGDLLRKKLQSWCRNLTRLIDSCRDGNQDYDIPDVFFKLTYLFFPENILATALSK